MFSQLTSKIYGALAILLVLIVIYLVIVNLTLKDNTKNLGDEIKTLVADKNTLKNNNVVLEQGIAQCNASIENYKTTVDTLTKAGEVAMAATITMRKTVDARLAAIDKMPAQTCADADAILIQGAQ